MESFVIAGKARQVFKLIEMKAKREEELKQSLKNIRREIINERNTRNKN